MGSRGSARSGPPAVLAPVAVLAGVAGMFVAASLAAGLGLRPTLVASELALASPALLVLAVPRWRAALALRPVRPAVLALAVLSGGALWAASLGLLELQYAVWAPPPGYLDEFRRLHAMLRPHGFLDAVLSVIAIAVAPAVCEELLFRGFVLQALRSAMGAAAAVVVSAALFAAIHLDPSGGGATLYRVPFAFLVGVGLAVLRLRTGSLVPAMIAHAVVNATTFAAALQETEALPTPRPWLGAALLAGGALAQAVLSARLRRPPEVASRPESVPL